MRQMLGPIALALVITCGGLAGCHKPAVREKALPDPLLTSKKPIEGKVHLADPDFAARELVPPPPPMPPALEKGFASMTQDVPLAQLLGTRATR